ncbi:hypothetical protein [uncultured Roseobacter sp.]|uniref:hypothetical protein n=1 Tax=uncultured Roseobacter sp. TaxID=114847 RepID=UPI0026087BAB|nr:hypothetical protein [uncultured Roseobacter sp.]
MSKHSSNAGLFSSAGLISAAVVAVLAYVNTPAASIFGVVWLLLFALTLLAQDTEQDARKINVFMREQDNFGIYYYLTHKTLSFLARTIAPVSAQKDPQSENGYRSNIKWYMTPRAVDSPDLNRLKASPWSWPVMDVALKLAIIYPMFFILAQWTFSGENTGIGEATVIPGYSHGWPVPIRYVTFGVTTAYLMACMLALITRQRVFAKTAGWLFCTTIASLVVYTLVVGTILSNPFPSTAIVALASETTLHLAVAISTSVAAAFAGAFASAGTVTFAAAVAITFAAGGAYAIVFVGPLAYTVSYFFAVLFSGAVGFLCQRYKGKTAYAALILTLFSSMVAICVTISTLLDGRLNGFVFVIGVLPLLNAVFDYLSYGATISFIKFGAEQKNLLSFTVALLDAGLAYTLLIGLGSAMVLTLALINSLASVQFLNINTIIDGLRDPATRSQYSWLYFTLFSTLIPTGIHVLIGVFSVTTWLPKKTKYWIAEQISDPETGSFGTLLGGALAAFVGALWCFVIALSIYFGGAWLIANFEWIGLSILSHVEMVANLVGAF